MSHTLSPEEPNGVLFDAEGRVVVLFAGLDTSTAHPVGEAVDPSKQPEYTAGPPRSAGRRIEADADRPDLPDPTPPAGDVTPAGVFR